VVELLSEPEDTGEAIGEAMGEVIGLAIGLAGAESTNATGRNWLAGAGVSAELIELVPG
jgi:hypothetical protein